MKKRIIEDKAKTSNLKKIILLEMVKIEVRFFMKYQLFLQFLQKKHKLKVCNYFIMNCNILLLEIWPKNMRSQLTYFMHFISYKKRRKLGNSSRRDICNFDVHRASYMKFIRSEKC